MVDKNIIQSRFTKLGVVPIDNQHYLYATLDNNLIGIIVLIKTCDKHYYDEDDIKVSKQPATKAVVSNRPEKKKELIPSIEKTKPEQIANNKRKGKKKEIPTGQFLLFEDL